jgi:hypothetical protein
MVLSASKWRVWGTALYGGFVRMIGWHEGDISYDKKVPWINRSGWWLPENVGYSNAQVKMFFSSGTAHTNGGGSFCIATYSFVS